MSVNRRRGIVIGIILVLLMLFFYRLVKAPAPTLPSPRPSPSMLVSNSVITKCQNVVVTPGTTVELFTYHSDNQTRFDYRVAARSEEEAVNFQVLSTGNYLYVWDVPPRYTNDPVPNSPGYKLKLAEFPLVQTVTTQDQVIRFGAASFSGDKLCTIWDGTDSVFEVPKTVDFAEGDGTIQKLNEYLAKICRVCAQSNDDQLALTCRQNLSCQPQ